MTIPKRKKKERKKERKKIPLKKGIGGELTAQKNEMTNAEDNSRPRFVLNLAFNFFPKMID
jgi:hypothetical protein